MVWSSPTLTMAAVTLAVRARSGHDLALKISGDKAPATNAPVRPMAVGAGGVLAGDQDLALSESLRRPADTARQDFLERCANALGRNWADQWRQDLRGEGRRVAGGWPGTVPEARGQVSRGIPAEMARRKMAVLSDAERELAVRTVYASARAEWRRHLDPEPR